MKPIAKDRIRVGTKNLIFVNTLFIGLIIAFFDSCGKVHSDMRVIIYM